MQLHAESKEQEQNHLDQEDHEQIGENKRKEQEELCEKNLEEVKEEALRPQHLSQQDLLNKRH